MLSRIPFEVPPALLEKAQTGAPVPTAVAGAAGALALESAQRAADLGLIEPVLIGDPGEIRAIAKAQGWDLSKIRMVPAKDEIHAAQIAVALARGHEVAAIMKGQVHTDTLMRAVVNRDTGLRTDRRISHLFHMSAPGRAGAICITDAAVNVAPDVATRLHIVNNAVALLHTLGQAEPRVAVLSATESQLDAMPSSQDAAEIARRAAQGEVRGALVQGPLALDAAISPEAAATKKIDGPVAGQADILVVPSIEAGNALFKSMVYYMSATAAGLVLGARVPITLTSRADPPEARLAAIALAAIAAAQVD